MDIFLCDINGTFTGKQETREEDLEVFSNLLNSLALKSDTKKIVFSFLSTNTIKEVLKSMKELFPYIDKSFVQLGTQFGDNQMFENGQIMSCNETKLSQINDYLNEKNVSTIYIADDTELQVRMECYIIKKLCPKARIVIFKTNQEKGLASLNKEITNYLRQNKKVMKI